MILHRRTTFVLTSFLVFKGLSEFPKTSLANDYADVVVCLKQMCGKGMPEGMATDVLYHPGIADSFFNGQLKKLLVCMMPPFLGLV